MMRKSPKEYKRMISRTRLENQEKLDFKIQEKMNSRLKKKSSTTGLLLGIDLEHVMN